MNAKTIILVSDFSSKPTGRYTDKAYPDSGQRFRDDFLVPALKEFDKVIVVLDGYNRYGRSFLDEAFGGLIRESEFKKSELDERLTYQHKLVPSIVTLIDERIKQAAQDTGRF